ncbi:MAG: hypothetical protein PHI37_05765 [Candidatus Gracilibacteria bacterium]|nr:hypothetical protein [Candidatus Gracilibacteria bacterium]
MKKYIIFIVLSFLLFSCSKDDEEVTIDNIENTSSEVSTETQTGAKNQRDNSKDGSTLQIEKPEEKVENGKLIVGGNTFEQGLSVDFNNILKNYKTDKFYKSSGAQNVTFLISSGSLEEIADFYYNDLKSKGWTTGYVPDSEIEKKASETLTNTGSQVPSETQATQIDKDDFYFLQNPIYFTKEIDGKKGINLSIRFNPTVPSSIEKNLKLSGKFIVFEMNEYIVQGGEQVNN